MLAQAARVTSVSSRGDCQHCGSPLPESARDAYCCIGCRFVARILRDEQLDEKYYALRGPKGDPVSASDARDRKWLEPMEQELASADGLHRVDLDIQGISCAACVWLTDQFFKREEGGAGIVVNPALGTVSLTVEPTFQLRRFVERIESCGYLLGPSRKEAASEKDTGLLLRMGLTIAFAMNGMIVAIALYAGAEHTSLGPFFRALIFGFSVASVLVGGSWFFKSAFNALRRGILHLDLPIALGIALAFGSSTWAYFDHDALGYFDPLNVFVALMLVGRVIQQRVLEANRRRMLSDDGVDALLTRRLDEKGPTLVKCVDVKEGDRLLLAPGDVVPVEGKLIDGAEATLSLDWINGESAPRTFGANATIPAGAFLGGTQSRVLEAKQGFPQSVLVDLLRTPPREDDTPGTTPFWSVLARVWTAAVLVVAVGAFIVGLKMAGDPRLALDRVTAVLIVTCPCAFGIAAPLAYEIVQARLRREGLFVRSASFLDRAAHVRRVVFDKTGTLTTGKLRVVDPAALETLDETAKIALVNLASRSAHPKSAAIARALDGAPGFRADLEVHEHTGLGVELVLDGRNYRLGAPSWVGGASGEDVAFGVDGAVLLEIKTTEDLRDDAADEVRALQGEGFEVSILSGDTTARVEKLAKSVGIARAFGDRSPDQKAQFIRSVDKDDTLVIGDGINDGPAVATAFCSGTPAIDRPFLAARSDFYLVGAGLAPIRTALAASRRLQRVLRVGLAVAVAYNVVTVGLAYAGLMTPLLCAVLMPASSLSTILAVIVSLAGNSWRASARLTPQPG